nr:MAG TPA: hypothetical protein [Caudoviricetes sp.]
MTLKPLLLSLPMLSTFETVFSMALILSDKRPICLSVSFVFCVLLKEK